MNMIPLGKNYSICTSILKKQDILNIKRDKNEKYTETLGRKMDFDMTSI